MLPAGETQSPSNHPHLRTTELIQQRLVFSSFPTLPPKIPIQDWENMSFKFIWNQFLILTGLQQYFRLAGFSVIENNALIPLIKGSHF